MPATLTATEIDLDGDGRADFVVHEWLGDHGGGRLVHANVAGAWRLLFELSYTGCYD